MDRDNVQILHFADDLGDSLAAHEARLDDLEHAMRSLISELEALKKELGK